MRRRRGEARALLRHLYSEALGRRVGIAEVRAFYPTAFVAYVREAVERELLASDLLGFDLERLGAACKPERDLAFHYLGLQTLYDRYLIHHGGRRIELPRMLWMRVAMRLAPREYDRKLVSTVPRRPTWIIAWLCRGFSRAQRPASSVARRRRQATKFPAPARRNPAKRGCLALPLGCSSR